MLYSELLLRACKKLNLVDATVASLTDSEKNQYAWAVQEAVNNFNNDTAISVGTETVHIDSWINDEDIGWFQRIVRTDERNNQDRLGTPPAENVGMDGSGTSTGRLKAFGSGFMVQEIPIRILAAVGRGVRGGAAMQGDLMNDPSVIAELWRQSQNRSGLNVTEGIHPAGMDGEWAIVNEIEFARSPANTRVVCWTRRENEGILRVKSPGPMTAVFDRAIYFPYSTAPMEMQINGVAIDPLDVQVDIPTNHMSYLCNLIALEIALENNLDAGQIKAISTMVTRQKANLEKSNVRDRVKVPHTDFDYVYNLMNRRAWR